jgi:hypothetical protein
MMSLQNHQYSNSKTLTSFMKDPFNKKGGVSLKKSTLMRSDKNTCQNKFGTGAGRAFKRVYKFWPIIWYFSRRNNFRYQKASKPYRPSECAKSGQKVYLSLWYDRVWGSKTKILFPGASLGENVLLAREDKQIIAIWNVSHVRNLKFMKIIKEHLLGLKKILDKIVTANPIKIID